MLDQSGNGRKMLGKRQIFSWYWNNEMSEKLLKKPRGTILYYKISNQLTLLFLSTEFVAFIAVLYAWPDTFSLLDGQLLLLLVEFGVFLKKECVECWFPAKITESITLMDMPGTTLEFSHFSFCFLVASRLEGMKAWKWSRIEIREYQKHPTTSGARNGLKTFITDFSIQN